MRDRVAARQELERLDRLILRSEGLDPDALGFTFRPLWQLDEAELQADWLASDAPLDRDGAHSPCHP